jgi:general stress protein YciG
MNPTLVAYFSEMGKKGGKARAKKLSKKRLSEIGKMGGRPRKLDR